MDIYEFALIGAVAGVALVGLFGFQILPESYDSCDWRPLHASGVPVGSFEELRADLPDDDVEDLLENRQLRDPPLSPVEIREKDCGVGGA